MEELVGGRLRFFTGLCLALQSGCAAAEARCKLMRWCPPVVLQRGTIDEDSVAADYAQAQAAVERMGAVVGAVREAAGRRAGAGRPAARLLPTSLAATGSQYLRPPAEDELPSEDALWDGWESTKFAMIERCGWGALAAPRPAFWCCVAHPPSLPLLLRRRRLESFNRRFPLVAKYFYPSAPRCGAACVHSA